VLLPPSVRHALEEKSIQWPFYFRISSDSSDVSSVCAVPKFEGPEGKVVVPVWVRPVPRSLGLWYDAACS
jgi:hypothetical protein